MLGIFSSNGEPERPGKRALETNLVGQGKQIELLQDTKVLVEEFLKLEISTRTKITPFKGVKLNNGIARSCNFHGKERSDACKLTQNQYVKLLQIFE